MYLRKLFASIFLILLLAFSTVQATEHDVTITGSDGTEVEMVLTFGPVNFGAEFIFNVSLANVDINGGRPSLSMTPGRDGDPDGFNDCTLMEDGGDPLLVRAVCLNIVWPDLFTGAGYMSTVTVSQSSGPLEVFNVVVTGD